MLLLQLKTCRDCTEHRVEWLGASQRDTHGAVPWACWGLGEHFYFAR